MITFGRWTGISLFYFMLVALIGTVLRSFPFTDAIPFEYRHLIHSHSHLAMLGWVFNVLLLAVVREFLPREWIDKPRFRWMFWTLQACVMGMFVAFMLQGYALWSIALSTLHILLSYVLIVWIIRDAGLLRSGRNIAGMFLLAALAFLFLSSLGPWALAIISAKGMAGSPLYKSAIYWFLHFTYNGWMCMALIGIWLKAMEKAGLTYNSSLLKGGFYLLLVAIPATFLLSLFEFGLNRSWHYAGLFVGVLQLAGFIAVGSSLDWRQMLSGKVFGKLTSRLLVFSSGMLLLKAVLQLLSAVPTFNLLAFYNRDMIILYLHLVLIGWVSLSCLAYLMDQRLVRPTKSTTIIFSSLVAGFVFQELVLAARSLHVFPGVSAPVYDALLLLAAMAMFLSLVLLLVWLPAHAPSALPDR